LRRNWWMRDVCPRVS